MFVAHFTPILTFDAVGLGVTSLFFLNQFCNSYTPSPKLRLYQQLQANDPLNFAAQDPCNRDYLVYWKQGYRLYP